MNTAAEWVTAAVALILAAGQAFNVIVTLKLRVEILSSKQEILKDVEANYQRKDVAAAEEKGFQLGAMRRKVAS